MRPDSRAMRLFIFTGRSLWPALVLTAALLLPQYSRAVGTWVPLNNHPPDSIDTMLLFPNGTVMAASGSPNSGNTGNAWYLLTPDSHGSYVNGTWTTLAPMNYTRLYYSSQVLQNDTVFVAGSEYGTGTNSAEIYNPQANTWTVAPPAPPNQRFFYDSISEVISNGNVLVAPVDPATFGGTMIWNTASSTWSTGPSLYRGDDQDEASWVKLPDNSILTIDPFGTNSERYIPSMNQWINDANAPVEIYDPVYFEMGPGLLLPDGRAFFVGATGNTVFYTPSGSTSMGAWTAGPLLPNSQVSADAPGAMMVNGKGLYAISPGVYSNVTTFCEFDPVANSFTQVNGPDGNPNFGQVSFAMRMLDLPDGTVLLSVSGEQLYVYEPDGSPLAAGKPVINTLTTNSDGSYHLTGTLFNGISEGAAYGDDAQMDSNYPLVRMTNSFGQVFYARTLNWSSTGVMTGTNIVSTDFVLPASFSPGAYSLVVSANGNVSAPISFVYSPDALLAENPTSLTFAGNAGGPFSPSSISFTLTNVGATTLNWSVGNSSTWLNASSTSGTLTPGGASATVTLSLLPAANSLPFGTYSATISFTNLSDHVVQSRVITLQADPPQLVQNGGFETGDFTHWTLNGDGYPDTFVDDGTSFYIEPHSGTYFALLGEQLTLGFLSQTISTVPGQPYLFSSWVNSPDGVAPNECRISWNGTTLFDQVNMPELDWTNFQFIVTATGTSTVIQFGGRDDNSYLGLDDVSVTPVRAPAFQSATKTSSTVNLTWSSLSGLAYQLQYTTNLVSGPWINIGNPITANSNSVNASDNTPSGPIRFYRLILLP